MNKLSHNELKLVFALTIVGDACSNSGFSLSTL